MYVSHSFLQLDSAGRDEEVMYTVKSALAETAFAASLLSLADQTAPYRSTPDTASGAHLVPKKCPDPVSSNPISKHWIPIYI